MNQSRILVPAQFRVATGADGKRTLVGTAVVYEQLSDELGWFREIVKRGAMTKALGKSDTRCLINHDASRILGRTKSSTLRLIDGPDGLAIECDLPKTTYAEDLIVSIERGDISQMSFAFDTAPGGARWTYFNGEKPDLREVTDIEYLWDVSPVTYPAYPQTEVSLRSAHSDAIRKEYEAAKRGIVVMSREEAELQLAEAEG